MYESSIERIRVPNNYAYLAVKLYRTRGLNPRGRPKRRSMGSELPLLPLGNPIGFVPTSRGGDYIESIERISANCAT